MRRILVLLALGMAAALQASAPTGSIGAFIGSEMPVSGVPGLAYSVVKDGAPSEVGERGVMVEGGAEVATDTVFILGSVSKSFTALAVMQLVEAGRIELDAPIANYLTVFSDQPSGQITIRQFLSHTSGYSILQGNQSQTDFAMDDKALLRRVAGVASMQPAYTPGERWDYSNANYQVLGRLIEITSGQDYAAYIEANVLEPAGMADSYVYAANDNPKLATGHRPWFGFKRPISENYTGRGSTPQGGIVASASDVARYMVMMMNGQDDLISAAGKAQMMSPANNASPEYGFGWFLNSEEGTVFHSGSNPGYEALVTMVPAEQKGAAVLVNAGSGTGFGKTFQLRKGITARAIGLDYNGEAEPWPEKVTFIGLALLPIIYLLGILWAWRKREKLSAKRASLFGKFSLWFPLLTTIGAAWAIVCLVPSTAGAPLDTIGLFQPDMGLLLIATAVLGLVWAVFRLGVAYTGRQSGPVSRSD